MGVLVVTSWDVMVEFVGLSPLLIFGAVGVLELLVYLAV